MRLNFEFPEDRIEELKQLQQATRAESMKELVNNAFALLEWAVKETAKGNEIAAINEQTKTFRVLVLPLLERTARSGSQPSGND